jgi:hypothetical protein
MKFDGIAKVQFFCYDRILKQTRVRDLKHIYGDHLTQHEFKTQGIEDMRREDPTCVLLTF